MEKIVQAQIYEVVTDCFLVNNFHIEAKKKPRKVHLEKGEKFEIRFPYAWHFRTEDNNYYQASEEEILDNCKIIGKVWEQVRWINKASLEQILELELYDVIKIK